MVDEGPAAGPLQHVVQVVLQPAVLGVPAAARPAAVGQRFPQQAHAGAVLPAAALPQPGGGGRAGGAQQQQAVPAGRRARQRSAPARFHILHARRRRAALHPEPRRAALLPAAVVAGHGITPGAGAGAGAAAEQGGQAPRGGGPQRAAGAEALRAAPAGRGGAGHFGRPARRAGLRQLRGGPRGRALLLLLLLLPGGGAPPPAPAAPPGVAPRPGRAGGSERRTGLGGASRRPSLAPGGPGELPIPLRAAEKVGAGGRRAGRGARGLGALSTDVHLSPRKSQKCGGAGEARPAAGTRRLRTESAAGPARESRRESPARGRRGPALRFGSSAVPRLRASKSRERRGLPGSAVPSRRAAAPAPTRCVRSAAVRPRGARAAPSKQSSPCRERPFNAPAHQGELAGKKKKNPPLHAAGAATPRLPARRRAAVGRRSLPGARRCPPAPGDLFAAAGCGAHAGPSSVAYWEGWVAPVLRLERCRVKTGR